ncbi:cytochrome c oxidase assembly factor 5 [Lates calcarifer]|uniref:Cytochrome c oxidase assembly factor 5 n=1 Tax=Lates calcarifer TaxID=8187 RepID=A0A4W6CRE1_LATCA|nr:cytochrome c oxidase assembly factor 5 [Lates calcarifer]
MPKYYEDKEPDNRACAGIREDFKACLLQHDCVVKEGKLPSECLKEGHCKALQTSFFECKRSMLDTRSRFRGQERILMNHLNADVATWLSEYWMSSSKSCAALKSTSERHVKHGGCK